MTTYFLKRYESGKTKEALINPADEKQNRLHYLHWYLTVHPLSAPELLPDATANCII
jgi:hypothetical protein